MITNIAEIKDAVQIQDIIGGFLSLQRKGVNLIACCPFHNEKTPSFMVNPAKGFFKCFGCGKSGDAIEFLKEHEGMTYPEALRFIADFYKIPVVTDADQAEYAESEKRRDAIYQVLKFAQGYFSGNLAKHKDATGYLVKRDFLDVAETFGIGYAEMGNDLMTTLRQKGFSADVLEMAGLIRKNEQGHFYDVFRKRVMFPFFDRSGRVIGFTGRIIEQGKTEAKYLNSPETEVFKKEKFLYGLFQAKREIANQHDCYLVEGQADMISWYRAGITNVVAASGTALSEHQVKMIKAFTHRLTMIYDGDAAGLNAMIKNIRIPLQLGLDVYLVVLPSGEDPDSFVRKYGAEFVRKYIKENRRDIVTFRIQIAKEEIAADPLQKAHLIKELISQIALIGDEETRAYLLETISQNLGTSRDDLEKNLKKQLPPVDTEEKGFYGLDASEQQITDAGFAILFDDPQKVVESHAMGRENAISLPNAKLRRDDYSRLGKLTKTVKIHGLKNVVDENDCELPLSETGRLLTESAMVVMVHDNEDHTTIDTETGDVTQNDHYDDFLDFYVEGLRRKLILSPDTKRSKKFVEMVAEFLSRLDNTIIHIKTNEIAKKFGLTQAAFSKVLRPFIEKRKNIAAQKQEQVVIDDQQYVFDIAHLPEYVDQVFFQRYGFFPAQNKTGHKMFYVFRTLDNTLVKVGNFFMEPLFQVHDPDPNNNKRFVKLYHSELNKEEYVEFKSADMIEMGPFRKFLWNVGSYLFTNGKQYHHEKILESIALQFPRCTELRVFGWQPEGFFAFSNGIITDGAFTSVDELGLVKFKKETFYLPAFSAIYKDQRADSDRYEYDRFLVYKADGRTTWKEWSELMIKVYKQNCNGMWAFLFTILSANRSIIFPIDRLFTSIFFIGPTESGKSKIAESIRAPFMHGAPLFNLNSGTDAAFFTSLERFRDIPVIFEEYNDYQISDVKFQGLKAAVYDNEGKQKRKDASSKDIDVSKVNCSPVLLGQEGPERDDGALGNRVVQKHVPKKDDWTDMEVAMFKDLKDRERDGLSNIAMAIISQRPIVHKHFAAYMRDAQRQVKEDIKREGGTFQTRVINTVSLFIAIAKLWDDHVKDLPLPFSYLDFYEDAKRQIVRQSEDLSTSNRLSVFFDTISMLYTQGQILYGREFDISTEKKITVQKSKTETDEIHWNGNDKRVLFLIVNDVIQAYQKLHSSESLKLNALRMYLKDHPAYIGQIKSHRFSYDVETWETDPVSQVSRRIVKKAERNTSCIALDYDTIETMGIDLQRFKPEPSFFDSGTLEHTYQHPVNLSVAQPVQNEIPF